MTRPDERSLTQRELLAVMNQSDITARSVTRLAKTAAIVPLAGVSLTSSLSWAEKVGNYTLESTDNGTGYGYAILDSGRFEHINLSSNTELVIEQRESLWDKFRLEKIVEVDEFGYGIPDEYQEDSLQDSIQKTASQTSEQANELASTVLNDTERGVEALVETIDETDQYYGDPSESNFTGIDSERVAYGEDNYVEGAPSKGFYGRNYDRPSS